MLAGIRDETPHRTDPLVAPAAAVAPTTGRRRAVTARLSALLLFVGVVAVLLNWVFPAIAPLMPFNDITVDE